MADEEPVVGEEALPSRPELGEIAAARDSDEFIQLWANGIREADDPILKGRGSDLKFYDQVRVDAQVWSAMQQRRSALVARPWEVQAGAEDPASVEAAERLGEELSALDFDKITRLMHWSTFYGYGVGEIMWRAEGDRWSIAGIRVRRARRFGFDVDGRLMLRPTVNKGGERRMPEGKFWVATTGSDTSDEPYGLGLAHLCYWPVYFKRAGLKSWMTALNKYGSPTAYGKYPTNTSAEDQAKLMAALRAIQTDSALIYPDGIEAGYLQTSKGVSLDYEKFDRRMDAWIAKIILSQTMTTDDGSSRSQSETHKDVRDEVVADDGDLICGFFNEGPATWWSWWNFGDRATPPKLVRIMEDEEDQNEAAERDERLFTAGWRATQERVDRVYGEGYLPAPSPETPAAPGEAGDPPAEFAEDDSDAISRFVDELISSGAAPGAAADLLAPIVEAAEAATSFEEMRAAMDGLTLSDEVLAPLQEHLAQAAFAARLGGEVGASLRDGEEVEEV